MTTSQYLLNVGLLIVILGSSLGTRTVTWRRLLIPLVSVLGAGTYFLQTVSTAGNDLYLEVAGLFAGLVFGVIASLTVRMRAEGGRVVARAGVAFAAVWLVAIGGRMLFAYGAEHWFAREIFTFSVNNHITGATAWTVAFVLMALTMVITRVAVAAGRTLRLRRAVA